MQHYDHIGAVLDERRTDDDAGAYPIAAALDALRFDAIDEFATVAANTAVSAAQAAAAGDALRARTYLALLASAVASALRVAGELTISERRA